MALMEVCHLGQICPLALLPVCGSGWELSATALAPYLPAAMLPTMMVVDSYPTRTVSPKEVLPSVGGVLSQTRKVAKIKYCELKLSYLYLVSTCIYTLKNSCENGCLVSFNNLGTQPGIQAGASSQVTLISHDCFLWSLVCLWTRDLNHLERHFSVFRLIFFLSSLWIKGKTGWVFMRREEVERMEPFLLRQENCFFFETQCLPK